MNEPEQYAKITIISEDADGITTLTFNKTANTKTNVKWHTPQQDYSLGIAPIIVSGRSYIESFNLNFDVLSDDDGMSMYVSKVDSPA